MTADAGVGVGAGADAGEGGGHGDSTAINFPGTTFVAPFTRAQYSKP